MLISTGVIKYGMNTNKMTVKDYTEPAREIGKANWYVGMIDSFFSRGLEHGKISKYVVGCDTFTEAQQIARNAAKRPEMKYINVTDKKPIVREWHVISYQEYGNLSGKWLDNEGNAWD
jgi:hypothetical protein